MDPTIIPDPANKAHGADYNSGSGKQGPWIRPGLDL